MHPALLGRPMPAIPSSNTAHRALALSAAAVLLYGAIAAGANHAHGADAMLRAALVQGLSSGVTTLTLTVLIDAGLARLAASRTPSAAAAGAVALGAAALGAVQHLAAHWMAGTPELAATVLVPFAAAALYCGFYARVAWCRLRRDGARGRSGAGAA